MIALDEGQRRKLVAAARLLESDKPGERQAAAEALVRLTATGPKIADLLEKALAPGATVLRPDFNIVRTAQPAPSPLLRSWQKMAMDVLAHADLLNEKERLFAQNMMVARSEPSERQLLWLDDLVARVRRAA